MSNYIVNADDLGMTPGTNKAIFDGHDNGYINSTSIMTNCDYFNEAIHGLKARKDLKVGIHLNLTYGKSLSGSFMLGNQYGFFNLSYLQILYKSIVSKSFLAEVEDEFELQIQKAIQNNVDISHLDSHRHIHLIPSIYKIVYRLSLKYSIGRVRLVNENIFHSLNLTKKLDFFSNGGLLKYLLLRFFTCINKIHGDKYKSISFYSILYTGIIESSSLLKLIKSDTVYEIVVHPSYVNFDKNITFYNDAEKAYRLSSNRSLELLGILK